MKIYLIYSTFKDFKEAKKIGGELVKNKLAACTNIIPVIYSTYVWKKKTMVDKECSMIIKTAESKVKKAIKFIARNHSYDCPAITAIPIKFAHKDFKNWIIEEVKGQL